MNKFKIGAYVRYANIEQSNSLLIGHKGRITGIHNSKELYWVNFYNLGDSFLVWEKDLELDLPDLSSSLSVECLLSDPKMMPTYGSDEAAGLDLKANIRCPAVLRSSNRGSIPTGLTLNLPVGYEGQIRPRSGLAAKHGVTVLNSPGTIDSDYRGEIKVILINHGDEDFVIHPGDRIAQLVVAEKRRVNLKEVKKLTETARGANGFGSTGV